MINYIKSVRAVLSLGRRIEAFELNKAIKNILVLIIITMSTNSLLLSDIPFLNDSPDQALLVQTAQSIAYTRIGSAATKGGRSYMEDRTVAISPFLDNHQDFFVGVFDGHGGARASQYAKDHLHQLLANHIKGITPSDTASVNAAITCSILSLDMEITSRMEDGSTAIFALYYGGYLYIGNIGDSRAVFSSPGQALFATIDHKPENVLEKTRIEKAGAIVLNNRIWAPNHGSLAVARALGDRYYKRNCGLSVEPDILVITPEQIKPDSVLILACDGIWDVMDNVDALTIAQNALKSSTNPIKSAEALVKGALQRQSHDNLSALVVSFNK